MASLALLASVIILFTIFVGPFTYLLSRIGFPKIVIYLLSIVCFFVGINFCFIPIPVWYLGLVPIYFGYLSISTARKKTSKG